MADLASILAGSSDPQAAQLLAATQGLQLQNAGIDPNFGHNEGLFGALAKTLAGFRGSSMVNDVLPQIMAARQASLPEQARIYAAQDPLKELAAGGYSPTTMASILSGVNPENAAKARLYGAQAALAGQNVSGYQGIRDLARAGETPASGPMRGKGAGAVTGGAGAAPAPELPSGRPAAAADPGADPIGSVLNAKPGPDRAAAMGKIDPRLIPQLLQRLKMLRSAPPQSAAVPSLGRTPPTT